MQLTWMNLKYQRDFLQVKSHMMTAVMTNDFESIIVMFRDVNLASPLGLAAEDSGTTGTTAKE
jgi:hypothetical protein